jgi:hypothetical protein
MRNILRNRKALSTVVTTLIILVVSVLLAGVVSYFAINVTSTRVQEESLVLTKQHVWVASDLTVQGALMLTNTGGRDLVIDKITVRGQEADWSTVPTQVYYALAAAGDDLSIDLTYVDPTDYTLDTFGGLTAAPVAAATDIVLPSGQTMVIYVDSPDSITINDIGLTVAFTVFTSQAMYYKETNVQAVNLPPAAP